MMYQPPRGSRGLDNTVWWRMLPFSHLAVTLTRLLLE
ncbi:MAG: hypothetical protein CM15mP74_09130 [Halieaceae bacterium]|nr:MAG: hypothetical protein CM15mP74_09130 [Halieaceae bacterium]